MKVYNFITQENHHVNDSHDGGNYSIVCEYQNTRSGFRHVATLLKNNHEIDRQKVCYLNRTWERFTYETVIQKTLEKNGIKFTSEEFTKLFY